MPALDTMTRIINILVFIALTVLTGFSAANIRITSTRHLPIPLTSQILSLLLPLVQLLLTLFFACNSRLNPNTLFIQSSSSTDRSDRARHSRLLTIGNFTLWILSALDTALISVSAFALDPTYLDCTLENTWKHWFMSKSDGPVRSIQDRYRCCGLRSSVDRAWPFPDRKHNAHSCEELGDRRSSCLGAWEGDARRVLVTFTVVGAVSLGLKFFIAVLYSGMQMEDLSFGFGGRARRNDPARRRLLEQEDGESLPGHNSNGVSSYTARAED